MSAIARDGPGLAADVPSSVAWDPDGLLPAPATESHFARRERQRAEAAGVALQQQGGVRAIASEHLAAGGLLAADSYLYDRSALEACPMRMLLSFSPTLADCMVHALSSPPACFFD